MFDQIVIAGVGSNDSYEATVRERTISEPKKKIIKETVPFSNAIYDFSDINGELYWEERVLTYIFEIIADSPEELEIKKQKFKNWIMLVKEEELHDPFIENYHFIATFDDISCDDSEFEKSTITVTFFAYPYMISNYKRQYNISVGANDELSVDVINNSSHRLAPTIVSDTNITISINNVTYSIPAGTITSENLKIEIGTNSVTITNAGDVTANIEIYYNEEVL